MIQDPQHTLTALEVLPPFALRLTFADGGTLSVDLAPTIRTHRALAALADPALFATARLDSRGGYVVWIEDDLELAADNLRNLAIEQAGGIGHERLANWMAEHGLTQERAADVIGVSRRMLNYYLAGRKPIPKTVWLACLGWAAERIEQGRHQGEAAVLLRLIECKFGPPMESVRQRVGDTDTETLLRWSERIVTADSLDALLQ